MLEFQIPNLACVHCVRAVTEAVKAADAEAEVQVDLSAKRVQVQTDAPRAAVVAQLAEAGYAPAA